MYISRIFENRRRECSSIISTQNIRLVVFESVYGFKKLPTPSSTRLDVRWRIFYFLLWLFWRKKWSEKKQRRLFCARWTLYVVHMNLLVKLNNVTEELWLLSYQHWKGIKVEGFYSRIMKVFWNFNWTAVSVPIIIIVNLCYRIKIAYTANSICGRLETSFRPVAELLPQFENQRLRLTSLLNCWNTAGK